MHLIICHPELLIAHAISATLVKTGFTDDVVEVTSPSELTWLDTRFDLAIVSDRFGDELLELLEALAFRQSRLPILVLTTNSDFGAAAHALEFGAIGSVSSECSVESLRRAVADACAGRAVALNERVDLVLAALDERREERADADAVLGLLTHRQRKVLSALAEGLSTGDIARAMSLSPHTIRACVRQAGDILGTQGQLRIAAAARELQVSARPPAARLARLHASLKQRRRENEARAD